MPSKKRKKNKRKKRIPFFLILLSIFILGIAALIILLSQKPQIQVKKDSSLNVLLITLDTTRADRLGCYGYSKAETPNLDSLSENGVQFLNAYCQVPLTTPSHGSIHTGTYPLYHNVRNNGQYLSPEIVTLAEVLKNKGLKTAAFVSSFTVDSRFGFDQGFEVYDDKFGEEQTFKPLNSERRAEEVYSSFAQWMDKNTADQFFCWVHFFDPHLPYVPPSPYRERFSDQLYDGEIAYMDEYVGKTINKLKQNNLMDKTIIILAGDHGEALGEKGERGHGVFLYESTMRVPLIFHAQNHLPSGEIISTRVRLIDLMPSILDIMEIPEPEEIQGQSLLPVIQSGQKNHYSTYIESRFALENFGWHELVGLIDGDWKYIKAPQEELYNLAQDPEEEKNLIHEQKKIHLEKKNKLDQMIKDFSSASFDSQKRSLSSEEMQKLRSLGYIGGGEAPSSGKRPDPKDKVDELHLIQRALQYELEENYKEAAFIYKQLISSTPDAPNYYVNLALMQAQMKRFDEATQTLDKGLEVIPDSKVLLHRLGHTYLATGKAEKALHTFQKLLETDPQNFDALLVSAWILSSTEEKEEAQKYFRKALEIEPENKFARKNYALCLATSNRLTEAIDIYNKLKKEYPEDHEIYQDLGIAYGSMGDITKSIQNLEKAISIHPTPTAYFNLAVAMKKNNNLKEAAHYLRLYLKNSSGENERKILQARHELQNIEKRLKK